VVGSFSKVGKPNIRPGSAVFQFASHEAVSFYENPEYQGSDMRSLSDRNGEHLISIAIDAVIEVDREDRPSTPSNPENSFEAAAEASLLPMH
jgi:hypothetical protein